MTLNSMEEGQEKEARLKLSSQMVSEFEKNSKKVSTMSVTKKVKLMREPSFSDTLNATFKRTKTGTPCLNK